MCLHVVSVCVHLHVCVFVCMCVVPVVTMVPQMRNLEKETKLCAKETGRTVVVENSSRVSSGKSRQRGPQCGLGGGMLIMERDFRGFPKAGTRTLVPNLTGEQGHPGGLWRGRPVETVKEGVKGQVGVSTWGQVPLALESPFSSTQ